METRVRDSDSSRDSSCQGCKRDLSLRDREIRFSVRCETETKTFLQFHETETRPRRLIFDTRRDRDRDLARPRPRRFRDLQPSSRLATIDMGRKLGEGVAVPLSLWGTGSPSNNVAWARTGPRSTSIVSGILIHPAVWPFGYNGHGPKIGGCAPLFRGSWVPI